MDWFDLGGTDYNSIREWSRKYKKNALNRAVRRLQAYVALAFGQRRFFEKRNINVRWKAPYSRKAHDLKIVGDFLPTAGDKVVILGATWDFPDYMEALLSLKRAISFDVSVLVYDLIPIKTPAYVADGMSVLFRNWLDGVYRLADHLVAISEHTATDVREDLARLGYGTPVSVAPLAHEFMAGEDTGGQLRVSTLNDTDRPYVLYVGTVEARKNLLGLLRVWKALAEEMKLDTPRLLIAGKLGWGIDDFLALHRQSAGLDGLVRLVDRPGDAELAHLFRNCLFTVFPSFYEGWGLPIGEGLWFGKTCVTSNNSSMPEVGGDMCAYVDPRNLGELFGEVKRMVQDADYRASYEKRIDREKLRTWRDFADSLFTAVRS